MNLKSLRQAAIALGHAEPISIEPDGIIWLGVDPDRNYLSAADQSAVEKKAKEMVDGAAKARESALTKLAALGLTAAELSALLGA
jgi:hypothetical protein